MVVHCRDCSMYSRFSKYDASAARRVEKAGALNMEANTQRARQQARRRNRAHHAAAFREEDGITKDEEEEGEENEQDHEAGVGEEKVEAVEERVVNEPAAAISTRCGRAVAVPGRFTHV